MRILKAIAIAFSLYSRIPMPKFDWEDNDMRYSVAFFPWVGFVIGVFYYAVLYFGKLLHVPEFALALIMAAVPLIISGGFHVDGYMDTKDALNSYKPREEKLKILKDPHTGAFAVIWLGICGLVFTAMQMIAVSQDSSLRVCGVLALTFFTARCMSAFGVLLFKPARKDGMMHKESKDAIAAKKTNMIILSVEAAAALAAMLLIDIKTAVAVTVVSVCWMLIYANRCKRIFGGTTGDTAGYFLVKCELYAAVAAAVLSILTEHIS